MEFSQWWIGIFDQSSNFLLFWKKKKKEFHDNDCWWGSCDVNESSRTTTKWTYRWDCALNCFFPSVIAGIVYLLLHNMLPGCRDTGWKFNWLVLEGIQSTSQPFNCLTTCLITASFHISDKMSPHNIIRFVGDGMLIAAAYKMLLLSSCRIMLHRASSQQSTSFLYLVKFELVSL